MNAPIIRLASPEEAAEIRAAICRAQADFTPTPDDLSEHAIYIRENYVSDGPGYAGPVAIVHWGGGPDVITTLTFRTAGAGMEWQLSLTDQIDAARHDPATAEAAAEAGESIDEYLCGRFYGHQFPDVGERERCLCLRCGKDGDA
jgi:hypothetical protein